MSNYLRILLIEDSLEDAELLELDLRLAGYEFVLVRIETEEELRANLADSEWDIMISDYNLPRFNGMKAFEICKESGQDIPFILMSGFVGEEMAADAMVQGVNDYIMKNNRVRLIPAIDRELREARIRREKQEIEDRFRSLFDAMTEGVILYEIQRDTSGVPVDYRILDMNPASQRQLGVEVAACRNESVGVLFGNATPLVRNSFYGVISRMRPGTFELQYPPEKKQFNIRVSMASKGILATVLEDITERKRAELDQQREMRLNAACAQLSRALIAESESIEKVATLVLNHALSLTGSPYGYVAVFDPTTRENTCYGIDRTNGQSGYPDELWKFTLEIQPDADYPGTWRRALNTGKPFLTNLPSGNNSGEILPHIEIPIQRLLAIPVTIGTALVGQIVLANAQSDYTQNELNAVQRLGEVYALALERNRFYETIRERTRRTQIFLDAFPCIAMLLKPKTHEIVAINKAAQNAGCRIGQTCFQSWAGFDTPCPWCQASQVWNEGLPLHAEVNGGGTIWDAYWIPVSNDLYLHYAFNITAQKHAEEDILKFKTMADTASYGTAITDLDGYLIYVNTAFARLHGYPPEELLGKNIRVMLSHDQTNQVDRLFHNTSERTGLQAEEIWHIKKDGTGFPTLMSVNFIPDNQGNPASIAVTMIDITEYKALEDRLQQAQKMEAIGQLTGGVAHDFNNIIQVINGYTEIMLSDTPPKAPIRRYLKEIQESGLRAATLIAQLMAFSRRQRIQTEDLDLNQTIKGMLKILNRTIGENIQLEFIPCPNAGMIHADKGKIEQILMNLCVNARDAISGVGQITVKTECLELDENFCADSSGTKPGNHICLSVTDTGSGIKEQVIEHIFEPFFTTKAEGQGTGLGLATIYGIVKQHGGLIRVQSQVGKGSTFRIYLPTKTEEDPTKNHPSFEEGPLRSYHSCQT
jgi:PAS domain S-box-containing protein